MRTLFATVVVGIFLTTPFVPAVPFQKTNPDIHLTADFSQTYPLKTEQVAPQQIHLVLDKNGKILVGISKEIFQIKPGESNFDREQRLAREEAAKRALVARNYQYVYRDRGSGPYPYWDLIVKYATMYGQDPYLMARIMMAESGGNPYAVNRYSGASGLFQFMMTNTWRPEWGNVFDPECNIRAAAILMSQRGTQPWYSSIGAWS